MEDSLATDSPPHLEDSSAVPNKFRARSACSRRRKIGPLKFRLQADEVDVPADIHFLMDRLRHTRRHAPGRPPDFEGACLGIGAPKLLNGLRQAKACSAALGIRLKLSFSQTLFRFGIHPTRTLGKMRTIIPIPRNAMIIQEDVVKEDVTFLLGLNIMDAYALQPLAVENNLQSLKESWMASLVRKLGHEYYTWSAKAMNTFYTRNQLERLHRHMLHPSARKLYECP